MPSAAAGWVPVTFGPWVPVTFGPWVPVTFTPKVPVTFDPKVTGTESQRDVKHLLGTRISFRIYLDIYLDICPDKILSEWFQSTNIRAKRKGLVSYPLA